ncbi:MAG TPA: hypothetical protein VFM90_11800 [Cyclobacteriaceae bacterium]|nr:hypothetical protein [Cyclobacteriaceae bacterium]
MESLHSFLTTWDQYMLYLCYASIGIGVVFFVYYFIQAARVKDLKEKYDYINLHEIKYFWYTILFFIIAASFYGLTIRTEKIEYSGMIFFWVRLFIVVSIGFIAYFIFFSLVKIYYPKYVEKRLDKLRNTPRTSPDGNKMRKLSEEEEDAYMDAEMIAEEANIHSVDYDVWLDEKTGYKKIEKYNSYQHADRCPTCGYYTLRMEREEMKQEPTAFEPGLLLKHYKCGYCNHREASELRLAPKP